MEGGVLPPKGYKESAPRESPGMELLKYRVGRDGAKEITGCWERQTGRNKIGKWISRCLA